MYNTVLLTRLFHSLKKELKKANKKFICCMSDIHF